MTTAIQDCLFAPALRGVPSQLLQEIRNIAFNALVPELPKPIKLSRPTARLALTSADQPVDPRQIEVTQ